MKTLLAFLCLAAACLAAVPVVTIQDDSTCLVDGQNFGQPQDVIVNNPQLASAVGLAWQAYRAKVVAASNAVAAASASAVAAAEAKAQTAAADLDALLAVLRKLDLSTLPKELAEAAAAVLGTDKDRKVAALEAQKAELDAKIAEASK